MVGRPKGAGIRDKEWKAAVRRAVNELREVVGDGKPEKVKALTLLAGELVTKALGGDVAALKEIGDRLDGKPAQSIAVGGDPDNPVIFNMRFGDGLPKQE